MKYPTHAIHSIFSFLIGVMLAPLLIGSAIARADVAPPCVPQDTALADTAVTPQPLTHLLTRPLPIRFNELLPDPVGDDAQEFIELRNESDVDVSLTGWTFSDTKGRVFTIADSHIAAHGYLTFLYAESKIRLTNTSATFTLSSPDGATADLVTYSTPVPQGKSFSYIDGTWRWTSVLTPGAENVIGTDGGLRAADSGLVAPVTTSILPVSVVPPEFSALLPDPVGTDADEWIELRNPSTTVLALDGWSVVDASGKSASLNGLSITANGTIKLLKNVTKIALNNDKEELRLVSPSGGAQEIVNYVNAPSGAVYSKISGVWRWPTTTGATAPVAASVQAAPASIEGTRSNAPSPEIVRIADIDSIDPGSAVSVIGVVTLLPGVIGKTTFAIMDVDGSSGAFIKIRGGGVPPTLATGDLVRIVGKTAASTSYSITGTWQDVAVTGKQRSMPLTDQGPADLSEQDAGMKVRLVGSIAARGKRWMSITDAVAGKEVRVAFVHGEAPPAKAGDEASITGVVRLKNGAPMLIALDRGAATVKKGVEEVAVTPPVPDIKTSTASSAIAPLLLAALADRPLAAYIALATAAAAACIGYFLWKRSRFA